MSSIPLPAARRLGRGLAVLGLALVAGLPLPAPAFETEASIKAKINIAGRQRMLTQRIAAKACFVHLDVVGEDGRKALVEAIRTFQNAHRGLRYGDAEMGLQPEATKAVQHYLAKTDEAWQPYALALHPVMEGAPVDDARLEAIARHNVPVLEQMHKAVGRMERTYAKQQDVGGRARAINFAGAQRMLSQRIAKEFCLIAAGIEPDAHRFSLAQNLALFDKRQTQLTTGDETGGVPAPANAEIAERLAASTAAREALDTLVAPVIAGATPDHAALEAMATGSDRLLKTAHAAVVAMEKAE